MTKRNICYAAIGIILLAILAMPSIAAESKNASENNNVKHNDADPSAVNHGMYNSVAWVSYGPISLAPYRTSDWKVPFGGTLPGTAKAIVASLSIPWTSNAVGHAYSINTENNGLTNSYTWVQVTSLDSSGIPYGTWINIAADFGWQNY